MLHWPFDTVMMPVVIEQVGRAEALFHADLQFACVTAPPLSAAASGRAGAASASAKAARTSEARVRKRLAVEVIGLAPFLRMESLFRAGAAARRRHRPAWVSTPPVDSSRTPSQLCESVNHVIARLGVVPHGAEFHRTLCRSHRIRHSSGPGTATQMLWTMVHVSAASLRVPLGPAVLVAVGRNASPGIAASSSAIAAAAANGSRRCAHGSLSSVPWGGRGGALRAASSPWSRRFGHRQDAVAVDATAGHWLRPC